MKFKIHAPASLDGISKEKYKRQPKWNGFDSLEFGRSEKVRIAVFIA